MGLDIQRERLYRELSALVLEVEKQTPARKGKSKKQVAG